MFFRVNLIFSDEEVDTYYFYAVSLRKIVNYLIQKNLVKMTYDELDMISDEDLEYQFLKKGLKWIKIKVVDNIEIINLENGMKGVSKLSIPRPSIAETPFKNFVIKKK